MSLLLSLPLLLSLHLHFVHSSQSYNATAVVTLPKVMSLPLLLLLLLLHSLHLNFVHSSQSYVATAVATAFAIAIALSFVLRSVFGSNFATDSDLPTLRLRYVPFYVLTL